MRDRPNSETFAATSYTISETRKSKFDPDVTLTIDVALICPRCKGKLPLLEHGENTKCSNCGLKLEQYGNGLTVWD